MIGKLIVRSVLVILLTAALLWAGDPWKEKPSSDWTQKDVERILSDSPWAKTVTRRVLRVERAYSARGPVRRLREYGFTVRWNSARTVREAILRSRELEGLTVHEAAERFLSETPVNYRILVRQWGAVGGSLTPEPPTLPGPQVAYLRIKGSAENVAPVSTTFYPAIVVFDFPREVNGRPLLEPDVRKVRFVYRMEDMEFKVDFDLRKMVRDGKPDL